MFRKFSPVFFTLFFINLVFSQNSVITELNDFTIDEIKTSGFRLSTDTEIGIKASAFESDRFFDDFSTTNAWILNSKTRQLMWELNDAEVDDYDHDLVMLEDKVKLPAGEYELYYSTYVNTWQLFNSKGFSRKSHGLFSGFFAWLFDEEDHEREYRRRDWEKYISKDLFIKITGNGQHMSESEIRSNKDSFTQSALVSFTQQRNDIYNQKFLRVTKPVNLKIYALGEATFEGNYDFGMIKNLDTREIEWQLTYRNSDYAGGARKNRLYNDTVELEPGLYSVLYVTDDSHSYKRWNSSPPIDPDFWGITVKLVNESDRSAVEFVPEDYLDERTIVKLTNLTDSDFATKGFTVLHPVDLNIYAIGEGSQGEMYDYGWIVNAKTRKKVWSMRYFDSEHAGGAEKNRMADEIIRLEPGNYIVYYLTDGSHSPREWNDSPPFDQKHYGISIAFAGENFVPSYITDYQPEKDNSIIASLVRIGDSERRKVNFKIDHNSEIMIHAIGEGLHGSMYDYAWIENAKTGRIVWEMTYRNTDRAGGAHKNREFHNSIRLDRGEYFLYYISDDSHSFNDWNDDPPRDPLNWGVTLYRIE